MNNSPSYAADSHDFIEVQGARENNLKNISVTIPKRRLTVFTGVSGSGKSSLVFGTIAAESQRMINETYSAFVQGFMPSMAQPEVDHLEGITTAIIVDQERMGANNRSTVGTATDANAMLRTLFSKIGQPYVGSPNAFSFNVPSVKASGAITIERGNKKTTRQTFNQLGGMCPRCEGLGQVTEINLNELFDESLSLADGAITIPGYTADGWYVRLYIESGFVPGDIPIKDFTAQQREDFLYKEATKVKYQGANMTYEGLVPKIQKSMLTKDKDALQPHIRAFVDRAVVFTSCPECDGTRLAEHARSSKIKGISIAEACAMQISDLATWVRDLDEPTITPALKKLSGLLDSFVLIGLGYLSLDRPAGTLSGGEAQRTKMVRHLGSALTDVTYVFDEPTAGLHPHDIQNMNQLLLQLRDKGNTVLVVEHKPEVIAIADHVIDLGPAAGSGGGTITFEGSYEQLKESDTLTGTHLAYRAQLKDKVRAAKDSVQIQNANTNNLKNVSVDIPLGVLTVVTGVAGSGKSSLIHSSLPREINGAEVVFVDQTPIKGSRRSNPATYTGMLEPIRKAFAKANGVKPALFSANSEGACPTCNGAGVTFMELGFMNTISSVCETCEGRRFQDEVLDYEFGGKNIHQVLSLSIADAHQFFLQGAAKLPTAAKTLGHLVDVGLGYLTLGQPLTTLSGGERQRLKLAMHMSDKGGTYVLDEPTTGLHLADVANLLVLLDAIVDSGKSVIVIEHNQAVMAHADWIIDIGPGAGYEGGSIVFEGTPHELVSSAQTLTGQHLQQYVQ